MFSIIKLELLKKEYNDAITTTYYNYILHLAISQGQNEVVLKFLEKVPSSQKKGKIY